MTTIEKIHKRAQSDAKTHGIHLNTDKQQLQNLLEGLKENTERYGYPSCPCRIGTGDFDNDRDIICPCDYRDPDVEEYGCCYCALYVNEEIHSGMKQAESIPERRPYNKQMRSLGLMEDEPREEPEPRALEETTHKLFYCRQCGYVVFRDEPPYVCPICKAKREMFSEIVPETRVHTRKPS
ncbi:MAG: ferredoxin:glutaredoxin reductase [Candidatus Bathyarchaeota archaeon]|nr:ferredoxin:glutaredoxin reductase [Candidatus Bathyarchaeota archaeon]